MTAGIEASEAVPSSTPRVGYQNQYRVPPNTGGTDQIFETLPEFTARTANLPEPKWLIDRLVPEAGRLLVVAAPNAGKTWLALVMAKSAVALGRSVFLVLEEGGAKQMSTRFAGVGLSSGLVHVAHLKGVRLADTATRNQLIERLTKEHAPVLVLDPLVSVFSGDENDTKEMNRFKEQLEALVKSNPRALVVLTHHTSKSGERGDGAPIYAGRGSTVTNGWADCQLNLAHVATPKGSGKVSFDILVAKMRDAERDHKTRMTVDLASAEVTIEDPTAEMADGRKQQIRLALTKAGPMSRNDLRKVVGGNRNQLLDLVTQMLAADELTTDAGGRLKVPDEPVTAVPQ